MERLRFAILGAGAGGQSMAGILSSQGYSVRLFDKNEEKLNGLHALGDTITVTGKIECQGKPELITNDFDAAVRDVDVYMVTTTTDAHEEMAHKLVPYLRDGQIIMLNPGHVGGALLVSNIIRNVHQCKAAVVIAEAGDLMYACRLYENGKPFQSGLKTTVKVATVPASDVSVVIERLQPIFPNLKAVNNILETGFEGGGAMLHPLPSLMNVNKMDLGQPYDYYLEGITPSIARMTSVMDKERLAVCEALGLHAESLVHDLQRMYKLTQDDLYDLLQHNEAYRGIKNPTTLTHRFIAEDTLSGLVPLASVGKMLGVPTPMMDAIIEIGSAICERDFASEGRTVEKLGIAGKSVDEIYEMIS